MKQNGRQFFSIHTKCLQKTICVFVENSNLELDKHEKNLRQNPASDRVDTVLVKVQCLQVQKKSS